MHIYAARRPWLFVFLVVAFMRGYLHFDGGRTYISVHSPLGQRYRKRERSESARRFLRSCIDLRPPSRNRSTAKRIATVSASGSSRSFPVRFSAAQRDARTVRLSRAALKHGGRIGQQRGGALALKLFLAAAHFLRQDDGWFRGPSAISKLRLALLSSDFTKNTARRRGIFFVGAWRGFRDLYWSFRGTILNYEGILQTWIRNWFSRRSPNRQEL